MTKDRMPLKIATEKSVSGVSLKNFRIKSIKTLMTLALHLKFIKYIEGINKYKSAILIEGIIEYTNILLIEDIGKSFVYEYPYTVFATHLDVKGIKF